ncbi:putative expansin-A17 [Spatholobus suberectus]|nr:putative expansin-A17 [Spatholobus suberectus]
MRSLVTMGVGVILLDHTLTCQPAFEMVAKYKAEIAPIFYRKVGCKRTGGIRFTINGTDYFELVLISNVGGAGDISRVWIKGSKMSNWESMSRNWGANWQSLSYLNSQSLSFRVQLSNGRIRTAYNVAPSSWTFGSPSSARIMFRLLSVLKELEDMGILNVALVRLEVLVSFHGNKRLSIYRWL